MRRLTDQCAEGGGEGGRGGDPVSAEVASANTEYAANGPATTPATCTISEPAAASDQCAGDR